MNDRSVDQLLNAWMDLGPAVAPDRVADAARLEARNTRQTAIPPWWPPRRFPEMNNTMRFALAAAALVAALLGFAYVMAPNIGGPAPFDPSPTLVPSAEAPIDFTTHAGEGAELQPGSYVIDYAAPVEVTITVPDQPYESWPSPWYKALYDWGPWHQSNEAALGFWDVQDLPIDPCQPGAGIQDPAVGPSVSDLVEALISMPYLDMTRSSATLDGYSGELLEVTPKQLPADCVAEPILWMTPRSDAIPLPGPDARTRIWILDVEGNRLVVAAVEPADDAAISSDLQTLIDTIQIETP
jgi:hypothetical protein